MQRISERDRTHWLIRVGDGKNFRNSKYPFWGVKRGKNDSIKNDIKNNIKEGDILWFIVSKPHGGNIIAMAEFTHYKDRDEEPDTITDQEQGWKGDEDWQIEMHYKNCYNVERINIKAVIQCPGVILRYESFKDKANKNSGLEDLDEHYKGFIKYAEPKNFN